MATYVPAKVSTQFIFYVSLVSQANTKLMQVNPTIASGDFKVSIDGAALANLGTLPSVAPAGSAMVKITLSTSEMAGANATVVCSDAAGAEWCDLTINIPTAARQIDDLSFPQTSGRGTLVAADGSVSPNWADVKSPTTTLALTGTTISTSQVVASVTAGVTLAAAAVQAIWDALTSALTTSGSIGKFLKDTLTGNVPQSGDSYPLVNVTIPNLIAALNNISTGQVKTQVVAALNTDTYVEPGQGDPASTTTLQLKISYLFKAWLNASDQTASLYRLFAANSSTVDQKAVISGDGTTVTRAKVGTGA